MTTTARALTPPSFPPNLRPFDARRDMGAVADLVELCFKDSMDPDGRSYVRRMREAARQPLLLGWATSVAEWSGAPFTGYVWQEEGKLVGNASLISYFIRGRRHFLIANVAVHPDYRRRGIARQLTLRAIEHARQRKTPEIWLHVRQENEAAVNLYRELGFEEQARRTTWFSQEAFSAVALFGNNRIGLLGAHHWPKLRGWLETNHPAELSWHMSLNPRLLRPGLVGGFHRFLYNAFIHQWGFFDGERLLAALSWEHSTASTDTLWLAAPAELDDRAVHALLAHARRAEGSSHRLVLEYPACQAEEGIREAGFYPQQTLIWMKKPLS